jgi:hypothetical protein
VATQCSPDLGTFFVSAAEAHRQKLNNHRVYFMLLFAEAPVEEARNHVVDQAEH